MNERRKNKQGLVLYHDDYLMIQNELTTEQKGRLLDELMTYSLLISDRKKISDDEVEDVLPVIETDDAKLSLYFRWLAQKANRDEQEYRYRGYQNALNRQKGLKQKGEE